MMRFSRSSRLSLLSAFTAAALSAACAPAADTTDAGTTADAGNAADAGTDTQDAGSMDAGMQGGDEVTFTATEEIAETGTDMQGNHTWLYTAIDDTPIVFAIENYEAFGGPTAAGTFPLGPTEASYADCGLCVLLETDCVSDEEGVQCQKSFMVEPGTGTLELTALGTTEGSRIAGSLSATTFREVEIDADSFETTVVAGGDVIELAPISFDQEVTVLPPESEEG